MDPLGWQVLSSGAGDAPVMTHFNTALPMPQPLERHSFGVAHGKCKDMWMHVYEYELLSDPVVEPVLSD